MKYLFLCLAMLVGCDHTVARAQNASDNIAYGDELENCLSDLRQHLAEPDAGRPDARVGFDICVAAADAKHGVK